MTTRHDELYAEVTKFHRAHPEVWIHFERYVMQLIATGRERFGAKAIWERVRWESAVNPGAFGEGDLKLTTTITPSTPGASCVCTPSTRSSSAPARR